MVESAFNGFHYAYRVEGGRIEDQGAPAFILLVWDFTTTLHFPGYVMDLTAFPPMEEVVEYINAGVPCRIMPYLAMTDPGYYKVTNRQQELVAILNPEKYIDGSGSFDHSTFTIEPIKKAEADTLALITGVPIIRVSG